MRLVLMLVHEDDLDNLDIGSLMRSFISTNPERKATFRVMGGPEARSFSVQHSNDFCTTVSSCYQLFTVAKVSTIECFTDMLVIVPVPVSLLESKKKICILMIDTNFF